MAGGERLAWINDGGPAGDDGPTGFLWLGGFMSDMEGSKAEMLAGLARRAGRSLVRFDYSGHGRSTGAFTDGTIGKWLDETETVFRQVAQGRRIIIGSSMGGWLALLLWRRLRGTAEGERIRGMMLLAPAADFTERLMHARFSDAMKRQLEETGEVLLPSDYGDPYPIRRTLIEEGRQHLLLDGPAIPVAFPVRIVQGEEDADVPWEHALAQYRLLKGDDVTFTLVKGADHRLSDERALALLEDTALALARRADQERC